MATNQQNINIGTADNANDGDVLRAAFRKVRKMFAEIYGDTDAENLTDTEVVPATSFDTHITEKIQDTVSGMFSSGTQTNVTVTYDDNDGSIDLNVAADITDVNAGDGLTGVNESSGAATLNVGAGTGITVNADNIQITNGGVGTTQLATDAVNGTKIADDSIDSEHYVDGSIDTAHFSLTAAINVNVDQNSGTIQLWSGTQAQYDALTPDASTIYFIV